MNANLQFRICLRVQNIEASRAMLRRPDAAYLPSGQPGRGYFQVGERGVFKQFQTAYAGGDYYDAIMLDDNLLFLIVADVTGHGAQASISMAIVRSFIHQGNLGKTPHTTLKRLNRYLLDYGPTQHFVTAQAAVIDLEKKYIHVAYAGHPPILHLRAASCQPIKAPRAFFLRFRPDADFKSGGLQLLPGDRILFYTDGVIETFDPDGQMYNIEGMQQFLEKNHDQPVSALPTALETDLHRFSQGSPMEDDITFMVIEMV